MAQVLKGEGGNGMSRQKFGMGHRNANASSKLNPSKLPPPARYNVQEPNFVDIELSAGRTRKVDRDSSALEAEEKSSIEQPRAESKVRRPVEKHLPPFIDESWIGCNNGTSYPGKSSIPLEPTAYKDVGSFILIGVATGTYVAAIVAAIGYYLAKRGRKNDRELRLNRGSSVVSQGPYEEEIIWTFQPV